MYQIVKEECQRMSSREGLFGFITRLSRPPRFDSDADLLERFIRESNEAAFRGIVRRYRCRESISWARA